MHIGRALLGALIALSLLLLPLGGPMGFSAAQGKTAAASAMPDCPHHQSANVDGGAEHAIDFAHPGSATDCILTCFGLVGVASPNFVVDYGVGTRIDDMRPVDTPTARSLSPPFRPPRI